jgi:hypothetical protein
MIPHERLVAPHEQLGVLVEPSPPNLRAALDLASVSAPILDTNVGELRIGVSETTGSYYDEGPTILAGHQAEFFHVGVLAKTIAADVLAHLGSGLNLFVLVDSDTPKTPYVRAPALDAAGASTIERIAIPGVALDLPVEDQPQRPISEWRTFFEELAKTAEPRPDNLAAPFAEAALANEPLDWCGIVARGQAAVERELSLRPSELLRVSEMCDWPSFRAFSAHWILHATDLAAAHNAAQTTYRRRHRVRSPQRPVPALQISDALECPFWIQRPGQRRRRLFVQTHNDRIVLFADDERIGSERSAEFHRYEYHQNPWTSLKSGWRIRPRALALSAYMRLFIADVFIHGIGGAKYDEVTDEFMQTGFGVRLPHLTCITATARIGVPDAAQICASPATVVNAVTPHDLLHNPQRHLHDIPAALLTERQRRIAASERLRRERRHDRPARRAAWQSIRAVNAEIATVAGAEITALNLARDSDYLRERQAAVWRDREYFFALHSRSTMLALADRVREALAPSVG